MKAARSPSVRTLEPRRDAWIRNRLVPENLPLPGPIRFKPP